MSTPATGAQPRHLGSIAIIGALSFIFGFVTWLNGPLISFAKLAFDVSDTYAFLIPSAFYISYFCLALPASFILKKTGMKKGMALGLFVMAVGAAVFGEYTTQRWYPGAVGGIFVIGAGLAILQTAVNPYISILGPIEVTKDVERDPEQLVRARTDQVHEGPFVPASRRYEKIVIHPPRLAARQSGACCDQWSCWGVERSFFAAAG